MPSQWKTICPMGSLFCCLQWASHFETTPELGRASGCSTWNISEFYLGADPAPRIVPRGTRIGQSRFSMGSSERMARCIKRAGNDGHREQRFGP